MAKTIRTVRVAFGNRKLPREMVFTCNPVDKTYTVRMKGELEGIFIWQPKDTTVTGDGGEWMNIRAGQWVASIQREIGGRIRETGALVAANSARQAYIDMLDHMAWR